MSPEESLLLDAEQLLDCRDQRALRALHHAEQCGADPDRCAAGRWMAHMLAGDFAAAWRESDAIRLRGAPDPHRIWDGKPLEGRHVIVRCLHGLGDAIQFLRYAPRLRSITSSLIVEVPPRLLDFAPCIAGIDQVVTWGLHAPAEAVHWDAQIEVVELPYIFRTDLQELPIAEQYVHLPRSHQQRIATLMGESDRPRIGLVWAAGDWNPSRSIPFPVIEPLESNQNCEFWNLQGGAAHADWQRLPRSSRLRDIAEVGDGVMNLACTIAQLDLVITVDTLAAHLAGAMGVPTWLLLQYSADWRWLANGSASPWYPSLRLFRQPSPGDWHSLIAEVKEELTEWTQLCPSPQRIR
jgi:hypothetical protein